MKRIFFVEDDLGLISGLRFALERQGYQVTVAQTQEDAGELWKESHYDMVILDVSLPDGSGCDICRKIRKSSTVPIMFLTSADEETDVTMGLDIGGDDYITKPFKLAIFLSRVNALLRRGENYNQSNVVLESNGISVQMMKREVSKDGKQLELTTGEFKLLCYFMENPDIVLSTEQILGRLWDCEERFVENSSLSVYIRRLRMKIEDDPGEPKRIITVRGAGYKWDSKAGGV